VYSIPLLYCMYGLRCDDLLLNKHMIYDIHTNSTQQTLGCQFGVAVASLVTSTKLLYVEPG